jgi:Excreted virulence factor EspC, type VII ESX diderm
MESLTVGHAALLTHAQHVEAIADEVAVAADAGRLVRVGSAAYGQLCVLVPTMLNAVQDVLVDGLETAADALRDTSVRLRTTAAGYDRADADTVSSLRGAGPSDIGRPG